MTHPRCLVQERRLASWPFTELTKFILWWLGLVAVAMPVLLAGSSHGYVLTDM